MSIPISIDTTKAEVARQALRAGARSSTISPPWDSIRRWRAVAADQGAGVVLMHMRGNAATMQLEKQYNDVVTEVYDFLARRIDWAWPKVFAASGSPSIRVLALPRPTDIVLRSCGACTI